MNALSNVIAWVLKLCHLADPCPDPWPVETRLSHTLRWRAMALSSLFANDASVPVWISTEFLKLVCLPEWLKSCENKTQSPSAPVDFIQDSLEGKDIGDQIFAIAVWQ